MDSGNGHPQWQRFLYHRELVEEKTQYPSTFLTSPAEVTMLSRHSFRQARPTRIGLPEWLGKI